eukprot:gene809-986_t
MRKLFGRSKSKNNPPAQSSSQNPQQNFQQSHSQYPPPPPGDVQMPNNHVENFNSDTSSEEAGFYCDVIQNVLHSPEWTIPIANFIDENCSIFDNEDENKFPYTASHEAFKDLVETLLSTHLIEYGITTDILMEVMDKPSGARVKKLLMSNITPVEDFVTFKKMMVKRNIELEQEVLKQLDQGDLTSSANQFQGDLEGGHEGTSPLDEREASGGIPDTSNLELDAEQEMLRQALEASRKEAEAQVARENTDEENLRRAIELSKQDLVPPVNNNMNSSNLSNTPPSYDQQFSGASASCGFAGEIPKQNNNAAFEQNPNYKQDWSGNFQPDDGNSSANNNQNFGYTDFDKSPYDTPDIQTQNANVNRSSFTADLPPIAPTQNNNQNVNSFGVGFEGNISRTGIGAHFLQNQPAGNVGGAHFQNETPDFLAPNNSNFAPTNVYSPEMNAAPPPADEIKRRADYMKKQRDLLIAKRKEQREKNAPPISREKSCASDMNPVAGPGGEFVESEIAQQLRRNSTEFKQAEANQLQVLREESDKQEKRKSLMLQLRKNLDGGDF